RRDTDLGAGGDRPPSTGGAGAVKVEGIPDPRVDRGKRPGSAVAVGPGDVADKGLIQDRVDRVAVVRGPLGEPVDAGALGGRFLHAGMLPGAARRGAGDASIIRRVAASGEPPGRARPAPACRSR